MSKLTTLGVAVAASIALTVPAMALAAPANAGPAKVHTVSKAKVHGTPVKRSSSTKTASKVHRTSLKKSSTKTTSKVHRTAVKKTGKEFGGKELLKHAGRE